MAGKTESALPTEDAVHTEKALGTLPHEENPHLDKVLNRKFDLHILPWLFGIWLFSFIDRSNIGNARLAGLPEDLGIAGVGTQFNLALLVFYIPYILVDVPSNLLLKKFRAGVYLPSLITAWGLVCLCIGFVKSYAGLIVCRLLLGLFEGGILGGVIIYLAMFYKRHEMLYRSGLFYCAAPLSGAFGGLLAGALGNIEVGGYKRWPWIFFGRSLVCEHLETSTNISMMTVEGAATVVFGIVCFFFMPDTPAASRFLTDEERDWALKRMMIDASGSTALETVDEERFDWYWVWMAIKSPQMWFCAGVWFFLLVPLYSFSLFLPSIVSGMGYTSTTAQLFTVPPNMAGFVVVILTAHFSDKVRNRGGFIAAGTVVGIAGYVMLLVSDQNAVKYAGTFLIAMGVFQASPMLMGWVANNLASHYVRAVGVGIVISIANCSAFIGTFIYLQRDAPKYALGHSISLGALVITLFLTGLQVSYLSWENGKRDKGERDVRLVEGNVHRLGHRHPAFRYTL
ncbi:major facilitator superfamily domain-containing protein [Apiosordaria backusii]|uniref:Major facilitator superfamily domain-containing protein n=1 Tax=Apiosordaria backusii TaxID=314023 RepID=A0AA40DZS8_9PEZI|nr:major facilitator superfamily domain-containing protein [Apiosordaria backusii]